MPQKAYAFKILGVDDTYISGRLYGPMSGLEEVIKLGYKLKKASDAPATVKQFCYKKFIAQGLKADEIQIKMVAGQWLAAFGKSYLVFGYSAALELKNALRKAHSTSKCIV